MSLYDSVDATELIGYEMDRLTFEQRVALTGKWVAHEMYSPETLPVRRIEAVGESAAECAGQLASRGLDPKKFEFVRLEQPY